MSTQNPALGQRRERLGSGAPELLARLIIPSVSAAPPYTFVLSILSCILNSIIQWL